MAISAHDERTSGAAEAAFNLAQIVLWQLLQQGLLDKDHVERKLRSAVEAGTRGGVDARAAAEKLGGLLQSVKAYQPPSP
jgi:hypothetical protein